MLNFILQNPKEYVPLLAAIVTATVAFIGVILTLLLNYHLTIRAERKKTEQDKSAREQSVNHDRDVLRVGLMAEFKSVVDFIQREIEFSNDKENHETWLPNIDFILYKSNVSDLGLLSREEVAKITRCYYAYHEEIEHLNRRGKSQQTSGMQSPEAGKIVLSNEIVRSEYISGLRKIVIAANDAINSIEYQKTKKHIKPTLIADGAEGAPSSA